MNKKTKLHDENLKARLQRLLEGGREIDDISKLYLGKRSASYGRASFRELADFVAHPDLRNRGPVTDRIRDMRTTFKPMLDRGLKETVELGDVLARAESNFRMATDEQVTKLSGGRKRKEAERILTSALEKMRNPMPPSLSLDEKRVAMGFGDRLIWNPALTGHLIFEDFKYVIVKNGLVKASEQARLENIRALVILHAISVTHGVAFDLGDGMTGELQAGFDNQYGCLEVTAALRLVGYPKAVTMKVGLLWTDLQGVTHLSAELTDHPGPWESAIEVKNGVLSPIGHVTPKIGRDEGIAVIKVGGNTSP